MNVLHLNNTLSIRGGVESSLKIILDEGDNYGINSEWICIENNNNQIKISFYKTQAETKSFSRFNEFLKYFNSMILIKNIDLIHVHSFRDYKILKAISAYRPIIKSAHDLSLVCPGNDKFYRNTVAPCNRRMGTVCVLSAYKELCAPRNPVRLLKSINSTSKILSNIRYERIIYYSDFVRDELTDAGVNADRLIKGYYPIYRSALFKKDNNTSKVLYVGRLSSSKGVHHLIKATINLLRKGHLLQLTIVGDGIDRFEYEQMVPMEFTSKIVFTGWLDSMEIQLRLKNSSLLVFPSIYPEAFGISGVEAIAHGLPVIAYNVGGVGEWLKEGKNGILLPTVDEALLENAISEMLTNVKLRQHINTELKGSIDKYSFNNALEHLKTIYRSTLKSHIDY